MKSFWNSANFWTQVLTVFLSIFAIGGANLNAAESANKLTEAIWGNAGVWAIGSIVLINILNPLYHWAKKKMPNESRWSFLHSLNWWVNFASLIVGIGVMYGVYNEGIYDYVPALVKYAAERDWYNLLFVGGINFIVPLVKIFIPKLIKGANNLQAVS